MASWTECSLGEFAPLSYGKTLPKTMRKAGGVPVYGSNGKIGTHAEAYVNEPGIIIGRKGSVGEVHFSKTPFWPIDTTFFVTDDTTRDLRYTYYLLLWLDLRKMNSDSAVPGLNRDAAHARTFSLPPIDEQIEIGKILGSFDDKIDSNHRVAELIEDTARLLLNAAGLLNIDGEEGKLGDFLDVIETGNRPKGGVAGITEGVPSIGAESIVSAGVFDYSKVKYVPAEYYSQLNRGRLHDRDVLLYKDGGRPGQFEPHVSMIGEGYPFSQAAINEHVYRLRVRPPYSQDFLYFWLQSDQVMEEMRRRGTGVAIPGLNSSNVKDLPFLPAGSKQLDEVQAQIAPMMTSVLQLARQSQSLAKLRDTLMPELISGRTRVQVREGIFEGQTA